MTNIQDVVAEFGKRVANIEQSNQKAIASAADEANAIYSDRASRITAALDRLASAKSMMTQAQADMADALDELAEIENSTALRNAKALEALYVLTGNHVAKRKAVS